MLFWFDHIAVGGVIDDRFWQILIDVTWRDKLWFVWTFAPEQSTTKERWPQDAEDSGQCLSQQQSLQQKEEEDIRQCIVSMYRWLCLHGSIHLQYPSILPSMHPVGKGQANRYMDVCPKGYLDWRELPELHWIALKCFFNTIQFDEFQNGSVSTRDRSVDQF